MKMDNWNQDNWSNAPLPNDGNPSSSEVNEPIGYEGLSSPDNSPAPSDGRRNYEKYLAGETWTPENNQSDMMQGGFESGSQTAYNNYAPVNNPVSFQGLEEPVSVGEWIIAMLLMMVPCINIILMFVWAFGNSEKKSKSNYFKASLIIAGVVFVLYLLLVIVLVAAGVAVGGF